MTRAASRPALVTPAPRHSRRHVRGISAEPSAGLWSVRDFLDVRGLDPVVRIRRTAGRVAGASARAWGQGRLGRLSRRWRTRWRTRRRTGSELLRLAGAPARSEHPHLLLELQQPEIRVLRAGRRLQLLEVLAEPVARELLVDLRMRLELPLVLVDPLLHPGERLERRLLRQRGHRLRDPLLRLGTPLPCDQEVLLPLRLLDLLVQVAQGILQLLGLIAVRLPGRFKLLPVREVLVLPEQRLLREVVAPLPDRQHRAVLPILRLAMLLVGLVAQPLLIRDRRRDLLLRLHELRLHVDDDLIQHLLGMFGRGDEIVDVGAEECGKTVVDAHAYARYYRASQYVESSRRCAVSAKVMPSYLARNSSKSRSASSSAWVRTIEPPSIPYEPCTRSVALSCSSLRLRLAAFPSLDGTFITFIRNRTTGGE